MTPELVVQAQLDAYNAQDLDAFMRVFAEDAVIATYNGAVETRGAAAIRERYADLWRRHPDNRADLIGRVCVGDVVIDHEDVRRSETERLVAVAIYTVREGRIIRVDFVR